MITIIDYGLGNLFSVKNALDFLSISSRISAGPQDVQTADGLILPGVGAFEDGMKNLHARKLTRLIYEQVIVKKKPILGLCLGMQLFAAKSYEGGEFEGLGLIDGVVKKLKPNDQKLKIPHIGWNDVRIMKKDSLMESFKKTPVFYFVHSYHVVPGDSSITTSVCDYGGEFVATIHATNIYGAQFHPEKSQKDGLTILKKFEQIV